MKSNEFTATAAGLIDTFGGAAHQLIEAYRAGGERVADAAHRQWDRAFTQSAPSLSAETRRNAQHARKVVGGYYRRGVALSADGAVVAVDTLVRAAGTAVERAAAWQQARAR